MSKLIITKWLAICSLTLSCGTDEKLSKDDDKLIVEDSFPEETPIKVRYSRFFSDIDRLRACQSNSEGLMTSQEWDEWEDNASHILIYIKRARSQVKNDGAEWETATEEFFDKSDQYVCSSRKLAEKYCGIKDWAYQAKGC